MQNKIPVVLTLIILFSISIFAGSNAKSLAKQATSDDRDESQIAIKSLRQLNQAGLDAMFEVYRDEIGTYTKTGNRTDSWQKISNAIDSVAMQKDAYSSKLFWHTDFEKAKAEAQKTNKPILTLRLLGNLNEEYSCANSRFFRSILYTNYKISKQLRENYVLHWKSVRPAPKVTIDFGDGRKLVRTVTGNSIHYILDKDGKIIDALPGLYHPEAFYGYLSRINRILMLTQKSDQPVLWREYQKSRRTMLFGFWQNDLKKLGIETNSPIPEIDPQTKVDEGENPSALEAAPRAVTKMVSEIPTVSAITYEFDEKALKENTRLEEFKKIAQTQSFAKLDLSSQNFIRNKTSGENKLSINEFDDLITNLNKYVLIDTVQNELLFHTKIYQWLISNDHKDLETFNDKVYAELFLTPKSDKWLGLYSPDIYSAIENNGISN